MDDWGVPFQETTNTYTDLFWICFERKLTESQVSLHEQMGKWSSWDRNVAAGTVHSVLFSWGNDGNEDV